VLLTVLQISVGFTRLNGDPWGIMHEGQHVSSLSQQKDVTAFTNPFFLKIASPESPHCLSGTVHWPYHLQKK
jgi:hypothetical protein